MLAQSFLLLQRMKCSFNDHCILTYANVYSTKILLAKKIPRMSETHSIVSLHQGNSYHSLMGDYVSITHAACKTGVSDEVRKDQCLITDNFS